MTRRGAIMILGGAALVVSGVAAAGLIGGYRLNLTPSEALGLWRIEATEQDLAVGDLVFVCPPAIGPFVEAHKLGYLRRGLCAGGLAPLLKSVAALPGQRVDIGDHVVVDGIPVPSSDVRRTDGAGRAIAPYRGAVVPVAHLFLHSSFASSYDSRYFGPIPDAGLLGLARPVLTFDP